MIPLMAQPVIPDFGEASDCVKQDRTFCWAWTKEHWDDTFQPALLEHIIGVARSRGYARLSLETGSGPAFEPALALYRKRGFVDGDAFGDYVRSDFNQFLHLDITAP